MTAPERIWAWDDIDTHFRDKSWVGCDAGVGSVEYVRADLHATLQAENERFREALGRIIEGYGPDHLSKYARDLARAALK